MDTKRTFVNVNRVNIEAKDILYHSSVVEKDDTLLSSSLSEEVENSMRQLEGFEGLRRKGMLTINGNDDDKRDAFLALKTSNVSGVPDYREPRRF